jgi:putative hydrolase of the HAD superfamily
VALHTPPLRELDAWVFDLDNTLYPASINLFTQIDVRIKMFIAEALKLTPDEAYALQKHYYYRFGTTLRGLMINHAIDPDAFLDYVHDIDHSVLCADPHLDEALARLPGRKFVYTNGSARHAERTLEQLGIAAHFSEVCDIKASGYIPKPDPQPYADFIARHRIDGKRAAMFEDSPRNLKPAAALGMVTVWVRHPENAALKGGEDTAHCDFVTDDLVAWLAHAVHEIENG